MKCTVRAGIHSRPVGPVASMCSENLWPRSWRLTSHKITQRHRNSVDPGGTVVDFQQPPRTLSISSTISAWLAKNPAFIRIEGKLLAYARPNTSPPRRHHRPRRRLGALLRSASTGSMSLLVFLPWSRRSLTEGNPFGGANPTENRRLIRRDARLAALHSWRRQKRRSLMLFAATQCIRHAVGGRWNGFRPYSPHRSRRTGSRILDTRGLPQRTMVGMSKKLIEDRA